MTKRNTGSKRLSARQVPSVGSRPLSQKTRSYPTSRRGASIPPHMRRVGKVSGETITYVLDTNVLGGAPTSLFAFAEHDVCIVRQVWTELNNNKEGGRDFPHNCREVIRRVDALVAGKTQGELATGVALVPPEGIANGREHTGKLVLDFSRPEKPSSCQVDLRLDEPDDRIIMACLSMQAQGKRVVLVSNDGNCRVLATAAGIPNEPYLSDAVTVHEDREEDVNPGFHRMPQNFWEKNPSPEVIRQGEFYVYIMTAPFFRRVSVNEFLVFEGEEPLNLVVTEKPKPNQVVARTFTNFYHHPVFGVSPLNLEQEFALQLLMDDSIPGVGLGGLAGSGKTLLAIAAGLQHVYDSHSPIRRIVITRPTIPAGEGIGFTPGTEREKMDVWLGSVGDALDIIAQAKDMPKLSEQYPSENGFGKDWEDGATHQFLSKAIQLRSLDFMKGRTFVNTWLIIDETQDLDRRQLKMLSTRLGHDSKIVFLGNVAQIDARFVTEWTSAMSILIRTFREESLYGHITLQRGERHPFATLAEKLL